MFERFIESVRKFITAPNIDETYEQWKNRVELRGLLQGAGRIYSVRMFEKLSEERKLPSGSSPVTFKFKRIEM